MPQVAAVLHAVRQLTAAQWNEISDDEIMATFRHTQVVSTMLRAVEVSLLQELEQRRVTTQRHGLDTAEWWQGEGGVSGRNARLAVRHARELAAFPLIQQAMVDGLVTAEQSQAMVSGLVRLPAHAPADAVTDAQHYLLERATELDIAGLRQAAWTVTEVVMPEDASQSQAEAEEERHRKARQDRYVRYGVNEAEGTMWFRGRLPVADGEQLVGAINTLARRAWRSEAATRVAERSAARPGESDISTMGQLRADALVALAGSSGESGAPTPARLTVLVPLEHLTAEGGGGVLAESGETLAPSELRLLACDAGVIPAVMGGPSEVLDMGREVRLVTGQLRQALVIRDRGCVFPGCDRPPADCEAHHIVPWVQGGATSQDNLALLCPHHHRLVEPHARSLPGARWQVRMGRGGIVEAIPPLRVDSHRTPRRHKRYDVDPPPD